jgi:pimeloyl-ACP methyl ester carboxylesterase
MIEGESPTLVRKHGADPFAVVAVHGGPGAAGEMEPLARRLGGTRGVLEPMQTAMTVSRQVDELRSSVESEASRPVVLIGHSWGAWLELDRGCHLPAVGTQADSDRKRAV